MASTNLESLKKVVLNNSTSQEWEQAVLEWEIGRIIDISPTQLEESTCICGKKNLQYLFAIKNTTNGNVLFPVGKSCIARFNRADLNKYIARQMEMIKLLRAYNNKEKIVLDHHFFSNALLKHLYTHDAFKPSVYNDNKPENDYKFLKEMLAQGWRSPKQEKKVSAIIVKSILPFLRMTVRVMSRNDIRNDEEKDASEDAQPTCAQKQE